MRDVRRHNNDPAQTYTRAVNAFSDRTDAELRSMAHGALGLDRSLTFHQRENPHYVAPSTRRAVPPHVLAATAESARRRFRGTPDCTTKALRCTATAWIPHCR